MMLGQALGQGALGEGRRNNVAASSGPVTGTLDATLADTTLSAAAKIIRRSQMDTALLAATLSASARRVVKGSLSATTDSSTLEGHGEASGLTAVASMATQLADAVLSGAGRIIRKAALAVTTAPAALTASGGVPGFVIAGIHMRRFFRRFKR
jgi:hypothetical protein